MYSFVISGPLETRFRKYLVLLLSLKCLRESIKTFFKEARDGKISMQELVIFTNGTKILLILPILLSLIKLKDILSL
jgi:hypothetical protein